MGTTALLFSIPARISEQRKWSFLSAAGGPEARAVLESQQERHGVATNKAGRGGESCATQRQCIQFQKSTFCPLAPLGSLSSRRHFESCCEICASLAQASVAAGATFSLLQLAALAVVAHELLWTDSSG